MNFDYKFEKLDIQWDCKRTENSFEEGCMRKAYLMKRIDNN